MLYIFFPSSRPVTAALCFVISPVSGPVKPQRFIRQLRSSTGAVGGLSVSLRGTLKLVSEGGESVTHLFSRHILYFHRQSGDLN